MSSLPPSTTIELSLKSKEEIYQLSKEIVISFSEVLATRAYISIIDAQGNFLHIDTPAFDEYICFIQNYVRDNFQNLALGDCSIPFGGINLGFFKISEKVIVVIYLKQGPSAQLFSLKAKIREWASKLDEVMAKLAPKIATADMQDASCQAEESVPFIPIARPVKPKRKDLKRVPLLIKPLTGKEKIPLEDVKILQYCDGTYSVDDICDETLYAILRVNMVIRKYEKKKWLKVLRVV